MSKMGWEKAKEEMRYVPLAENTETATSIIVKDIIDLTDSLKTVEESNMAWSKIQGALSYLSAKDTMLKFKRDRQKEVNETNKKHKDKGGDNNE